MGRTMTDHQCPRCATAAPLTPGSSRPVCYWNADGSRNPRNWSCATMRLLRGQAEHFESLEQDRGGWAAGHLHARDDQENATLHVLPLPDTGLERGDGSGWQGYIIISSYKSKGAVGYAMVMCDDSEPVGLPQDVAEAALKGWGI